MGLFPVIQEVNFIMASVLDKVKEIAADKLSVNIDEISGESSFTEDLDADSLDIVELIMAIEEEFLI